jgi:hypothetical protein
VLEGEVYVGGVVLLEAGPKSLDPIHDLVHQPERVA